MNYLKTKIAGINPDKDLELAKLEMDLRKENKFDDDYDPTLDPEFIAAEKDTISFVEGYVSIDDIKAFVFTSDGYINLTYTCLLYTSPSPRDGLLSRMPSSA